MRTMMELLGAMVCRWNGKHMDKRRKAKPSEYVMFYGESSDAVRRFVNVCQRCSTVRPVRARKAKQSTEGAK